MTDKFERAKTPISQRRFTGLLTNDGQDPETHFPKIAPLRPPEGARALSNVETFYARAEKDLSVRTCQVRAEFEYDGGGPGKGGQVTLYVDGGAVGSGRIGGTIPLLFSQDETVDLGVENGTMVSPEHTAESSRFNGEVKWVQLDVDEAARDSDHMMSPKERFRVAMARQ